MWISSGTGCTLTFPISLDTVSDSLLTKLATKATCKAEQSQSKRCA